MKNTFYRGENIFVRFTPVDKARVPIPWANIITLTVDVRDSYNKTVSFSKVSGITENAGVLSFELTSAVTQAFKAGKLVAKFTYGITDASGSYVDILEEGITDVFINLQ